MATVLREELRQRTGLDRLPEVKVDDEPHPSGDDRYAIYSVRPMRDEDGGAQRRLIATTSLAGVGLCLTTLREEEQITNDTRVGILDRETRTWIINPWAKGA